MAETKKCEVCDQEIGASEKTCPKCNVVFDDLEEEVTVVSRAMTVSEKRRKAKEEAERLANPEPTPTPTPKRKGFFGAMKKAVK